LGDVTLSGFNGSIPGLRIDSEVAEAFLCSLVAERNTLASTLRRTEAERDQLKEQVARLEREVDRLKARLEQAERAGKRQAAPFARSKRKKNRKKPGRKRGHPPANRPAPAEADHDVGVPLESCPYCGGPVEDIKDLEPQVVIDIAPEVKPKVTRYHNQSGWCARCKRRVRSRHAEQHSDARGAAGVQVGPRALSVGVDLKHKVGVVYRQVTAIIELLTGLRMCPATLVRAERRIAAKCEPTYQALVQSVRQAEVVQSDETGWYIVESEWLGLEGRPWLWPIVTLEPKVTLYRIVMSRGGEVVKDVLGDEFAGALQTDGWAGYRKLPYAKGQDMAHLLRRCRGLLEVQQRGAARFPQAVKQVLEQGLAVKQLQGELPADDYAACIDQVRGELGQVLGGRIEEPANLRFANHLRTHEHELLTYLEVPGMPATTALVEQEVRPAVVVRKISGGNRQLHGAHVHEVLRTIGRTAERNGKRLIDVLPALLCTLVAGHILPLFAGLPEVIYPTEIEDWVHGMRPEQCEGTVRGDGQNVRRRGRASGRGNGAAARPPPN
jgi:transposase